MVSGLAPGSCVVTWMVGKSTCGSDETGSHQIAEPAAQHHRESQQRGGDRPPDEGRGDAHCCVLGLALRSGLGALLTLGRAAPPLAPLRLGRAARRATAPTSALVAATAAPSVRRAKPVVTTRSSGLQALGDHRLRLVLLRHRDRPHRHLVVRLHDIDEGAVRPALHGRGRRHHHLLERVDQQPDVDEAARPELQFAVGKFGLELDRAGGLIDLIVDDLELAACRPRSCCRRPNASTGSAPLANARVDLAELLLRQGEQHRDRLDLGDDDDAARVGRVHDVALVDLADAGAAGDRRDDAGVVEDRLGVVDLRLIELHLRFLLRHQRFLGVELLPRRPSCWPRAWCSVRDRAARWRAAPRPAPSSPPPGRRRPDRWWDRSAPARSRARRAGLPCS